MAHELGWQDGGSAELIKCGRVDGDVDVSAREIILTAAEYSMGVAKETFCPNCHKKLRLVWDVRIEEVE